jgi:hypothetical protein
MKCEQVKVDTGRRRMPFCDYSGKDTTKQEESVRAAETMK